jgi:hypothetical protein
MIYVFTPKYEYDDRKEIVQFDTLKEAIAYIEVDLLKNIDSTFKNGVDDYVVIDGKIVKIKAVEYVSRIVEDKG